MDRFKALRKMFNDAGVTIYAWKRLLRHVGRGDGVRVQRGRGARLHAHDAGARRESRAAQTHRRSGRRRRRSTPPITPIFRAAWRRSIRRLRSPRATWPTWTSATSSRAGGDPVAFIKKFNGRISSVHLKDRTTPEHGQKNLPWGTGDTPLKEILLTMRREGTHIPASIELSTRCRQGPTRSKRPRSVSITARRRWHTPQGATWWPG